MNERVYFCSNCGTLHMGSGEGTCGCRECGGDLIDTGRTPDRWKELDDYQKYSVMWVADPKGNAAKIFIEDRTENGMVGFMRFFAFLLYMLAAASIVYAFICPRSMFNDAIVCIACLLSAGTLFIGIGEIVRQLDRIAKKK